jgi:hypothetical protein
MVAEMDALGSVLALRQDWPDAKQAWEHLYNASQELTDRGLLGAAEW